MADIRVINPKEPDTQRLRVAAYCRVSSDSSDQLHSFASQVKFYTDFIGGNPDWVLADIYADEGLSGTEMTKREDFNRLISDCRKGKIDRLLTKSISRFARNNLDCIQYVRELKGLGVPIIFEKEGLNTMTLSSEMLIILFSGISQAESESQSGNVKIGKRKVKEDTKTKNGKYSGKFALTELLICGNCGKPYRRVTWSKNGRKKIVWRCISRLDHGTKYCKISPTLEEYKTPSARPYPK